jgi:hypothetical protein
VNITNKDIHKPIEVAQTGSQQPCRAQKLSAAAAGLTGEVSSAQVQCGAALLKQPSSVRIADQWFVHM